MRFLELAFSVIYSIERFQFLSDANHVLGAHAVR